jgi:uncharacterized protein
MTLNDIAQFIANELNLKTRQVIATIDLLTQEKTIPFIARYRKEITGMLDEVEIFNINDRFVYLKQLIERKESILNSIKEQGKLTDDLQQKINQCLILNELEDIYLPYKPKKRTKAMIAKEKGLEPLADIIWAQNDFSKSMDLFCETFVNFEHDLFTVNDVLKGVHEILAEKISEQAEFRKWIREFTQKNAVLKSEKKAEDEGKEFAMYYEFSESLEKVPPHRILAIFRGENNKILKSNIDVNEDEIINFLNKNVIKNARSIFAEVLEKAAIDSYKRFISTAIDRELRQNLMEKAELHAIEVFGENLKNLLLQAPLPNKILLGIDPGFRSGSKAIVVDAQGNFKTSKTMYPHAPQNQWAESKLIIKQLIKDYDVEIIAIGNGTASRETEKLVAEIIQEIKSKQLSYVMVSEAGASVYSASDVAREEFPDLDVTIRGAISIARRLQDPLSELVKIDPKSIGVGLYQHDVDQKKLNEKLTFIVEYCVNHVGVDLNTASAELLQYVAGLNKRSAKNIVAYRIQKGKITERAELLKVSGLGPSTYEQCAGFLRIKNGKNALDNTAIHPESYKAVQQICSELKINNIIEESGILRQKIKQDKKSVLAIAEKFDLGQATINDILEQLEKPGLDPRDAFEKPILRSDVLSLEDLSIGLCLKGTVRNVVDFGAFVDIGVKNDGLVHVSQLADRFIKNPAEVVAVGQIVDVRVIGIDKERGKVQLSMKKN